MQLIRNEESGPNSRSRRTVETAQGREEVVLHGAALAWASNPRVSGLVTHWSQRLGFIKSALGTALVLGPYLPDGLGGRQAAPPGTRVGGLQASGECEEMLASAPRPGGL